MSIRRMSIGRGRGLRIAAACLAALLIAPSARSEEEEKENEKADDVAAERLEFMLGTVRGLELVPDASSPDRSADRWTLYPKPILRWSNPVAGIRDGLVVIWTDGARPVVLAQVFPIKDNTWLHEFQSLAPGPFVMRDGPRVTWEPRQAGETFHPLADAPPPADSKARRLVQMRAIARQFTVLDDFRIHHAEAPTQYELRLMANPVYRYDIASRQVLDGAVFPFVLGTDPELFVVIEARQKPDGTRAWEYLLAPLTCWRLEVKYKDETVWTLDERFGKTSPRDTYHVVLPGETFDR